MKIAIAQRLLQNGSKLDIVFSMPILTAMIVNYKLDTVRIGIANTLEFIFIL